MSIAKKVKSQEEMERLLQSAIEFYVAEPTKENELYLKETFDAWRRNDWAFQRIISLLEAQCIIDANNEIYGIKHASYPFPPTFDFLTASDSNLADGSSASKTWDKDDWGAAYNCYIIGCLLYADSAAEFNTADADGICLRLERTSDSIPFYGKVIKDRPYLDGTEWVLYYPLEFHVPRRVGVTDTLQARIINNSAQTLAAWDIVISYFTEES